MSPKAVVQKFIDAYNSNDLEAAASLLAEDFERYSISTKSWEPMEKQAWMDMWTNFYPAFPDFHWEVLSMVADGDTVAVEVIESATFTGTWVLPTGKTIEPTGKGYASHTSTFFKINQDGRIQNFRQYTGLAFLSIELKLADILKIVESGF